MPLKASCWRSTTQRASAGCSPCGGCRRGCAARGSYSIVGGTSGPGRVLPRRCAAAPRPALRARVFRRRGCHCQQSGCSLSYVCMRYPLLPAPISMVFCTHSMCPTRTDYASQPCQGSPAHADCQAASCTGGAAVEECTSALLLSVKAALIGTEQTRRNGLVALGWLTRGLAMRGHERVQECLQTVRRCVVASAKCR